MYSGLLLQVIILKHCNSFVCDSASGTGMLHFPYLHKLIISSYCNASYYLRHIFSVMLEGCMSIHGIISGLQSVTKVSIFIQTGVSIICYASRLQDMEFMRPWNTV